MIIECPACNTRYDIKVDLPPDGRTVRCAKCEHVWRATPLTEDIYSAAEADDLSADEAGGIDAGAGGRSAPGWGIAGEGVPSGHDSGWAGAARPDEEYSAEGFGFSGAETASPEENSAEEADGQEESGSKVRWFGSFLRKNQRATPNTEAQFDAPQAAGAEPIPFPRPSLSPEPQAPQDGHARTLDDARAAVRNVFASLGEQRPHQTASTIQAPVTAYADAGQEGFPFRQPMEHEGSEASEWDAEPSREPAFTHDQELDGPADAGGWSRTPAAEDGTGAANSQGWLEGWESGQPEASGESDLDAQLRAALQAHFPSRSAAARPAPAPEPQFRQEDPAEGGEVPIAEALSAFWKRPAVPRGQPPSGYPAPQDEEGEAASGEIVFDERLFREIEETREQANQPRLSERSGALALAAAWGLFLCIAGGLTAGLFAFRDIAADALPGLAPFYRALGMPVTVQPLIFEGVQYEWTVADFKPVLHIKGAVYNRAERGVKVPGFIVSVKDNDPALDREFPATLPVDGDKIKPEDRTEFELELVAPSASITAVELELRGVR